MPSTPFSRATLLALAVSAACALGACSRNDPKDNPPVQGASGGGTADAGASGTQQMGNRSQTPQPGGGLNGGLSNTMPPGATTSSTQEGVAPRGSPGGIQSR